MNQELPGLTSTTLSEDIQKSTELFMSEMICKFVSVLSCKGICHVHYSSTSVSRDLARNLRFIWLNTFACNCSLDQLEEKHVYSHLWHVFAYVFTEFTSGDIAIGDFDSLKKESCFVFFRDDYQGMFYIEDAQDLVSSDFIAFSDIDTYVMSKDRSWSYVITHEHNIGIGPFFTKRTF